MLIFIRGLSDSRAFRRKYTGKNTSESLGNHANFVINFCQILFDPKSRELHQGGADHESVR
jgi:hypothetical protein